MFGHTNLYPTLLTNHRFSCRGITVLQRGVPQLWLLAYVAPINWFDISIRSPRYWSYKLSIANIVQL